MSPLAAGRSAVLPNNQSTIQTTIPIVSRAKMSYLENGWFHEIHNYMDLGISLALEIDEVLYQEKSEYQDIQVYRR